MEHSDAVLWVRGLVRRLGCVEAVAGIDLEVARGEVVALLGPNGAGKTTTLPCIAGLLAPNAAAIRIVGDAERSARERRAAYVPEVPIVYDDLTAASLWRSSPRRANSRMRTRSSRAPWNAPVSPLRDRPAGTLSKGNRQCLCLAGALVARANVVLLDEPTTGSIPPCSMRCWSGRHRRKGVGGIGNTVSQLRSAGMPGRLRGMAI